MRTKSNIEKAYWESVHDQATDNYPAEVSISGWTFVCEGAVYSQLMAVIHQDVVRKLFDTEQEVHDHLDSRVRDGAMGEVLRARMRVVYVRFTASAVIVEEGKPTLADLCRAVLDTQKGSGKPDWDEAAAIRAQSELHIALGSNIFDQARAILAGVRQC